MNRRPSLPPLSEAQLEILNLFWDHGELSVTQVWNKITENRNVTRNTVQTMIFRLRDKGWLIERIEGSLFTYRAAQKRHGTQKQMVGRLLKSAFSDSAVGLVMSLLESRRLSQQDADRIRKIIDQAEGDKK